MISNNNDFSPKTIGVTDESVSGSGTDYTISPSVFDGEQNFISPSGITFSGQPIGTLTVTPGHVSSIDVAVTKILDPGTYYGSFILSGPGTIRVPAVISTSPIISVSMIIVFIGILSSIALVGFGKLKNKEASCRLTTKANVAQGVKDMALYKVEKYKLRYDGFGQTRTILIDVIPGLFALVLAYVGLVNNEIVGTITDPSFQNVIALFTLGLGIESAKELADRVSVI